MTPADVRRLQRRHPQRPHRLRRRPQPRLVRPRLLQPRQGRRLLLQLLPMSELSQGQVPWATWPWNRCPARREDYARCDLRKGHAGDHLLERGIGGNWPWSTEYTDRVIPPGKRTDGPMQQNEDGSWSPAQPLPDFGWKARLEQRLRRRGHMRLATILAAWDERGLGR